MRKAILLLATMALVGSASAFAGRDGADIVLQQQQLKRLQNERAQTTPPGSAAQQMIDECRKMMSQRQS